MADVQVRRVLAPNPSAMTAEGTNTWIVGQGSVAVIDPGPDIDAHLGAILAALSPGETVSHIIVTHAHLDHSALARRLSAATSAPVLGFGPHDAGRSAVMASLAATGQGSGGEGADTGFMPDRCLVDGDTVQGNGWQLEVVHTPGHLSGHVSLALGGTLFSGDQVMGWAPSLISPPDGDMGAYMASLKRLSARVWHRFLPGHGAAVEDPSARLRLLMDHRLAREAAVLRALEGGPCSLGDIVATVYADTPVELHPAAARNAFAHLIDLCTRGLVAAEPSLSPAARFRRS